MACDGRVPAQAIDSLTEVKGRAPMGIGYVGLSEVLSSWCWC